MSIHFKTTLLALSVAATFGFSTNIAAAQSTGPAAFAAKQEIKNKVLTAISDGKITMDERREILSHAKNNLSAKEYVGLVETMNRLSPPDRPIPDDLGYTPAVDKQFMAKFPSPDISWVNKSKFGEAISNSRESFVKDVLPKQSITIKEATPKQTYIVKEIITKQTVVEGAPQNQSVAKTTAPKQTVIRVAPSKQSVAKTANSMAKANTTAKSNASAKKAEVIVIPPPPPLQEEKDQPNLSTVGKVQRAPKAEYQAPPMPPVERSQTRNASADKSNQQNISTIRTKSPTIVDPVSIKQPAGLLNTVERSSITHFYADYSVPVLNTPAAALLINRNGNAIQASFEQPLQPESGQSIIRQ